MGAFGASACRSGVEPPRVVFALGPPMPNRPQLDDMREANRRLRDIVALSTLPAMWSGADPLRIAESLAAALFTTLGPELVFVSFRGGPDGPIAVAQTGRYETDPQAAKTLDSAVFEWARSRDPDELLVVANPVGPGTLRIATRALGLHAEQGVIAAGFVDEGSPSSFDRLVLNVGASQAATAVQNVRLLYERKRAEEALRQADRRKDEFLATLAHELRNPLAPIRNSLQIMRLAEDDSDTVERARQIIERQIEQMVRLVDDLLDLSRITRNKVEIRRERVEVQAIVESAVETSRPLIDACGHELDVSLPEHAVWLNADLARMAQVVANLLNNAAKYTPAGGHIGLAAEVDGEEAVLRVRDDGIGIPAEALPHIFEMFAQADTSVARSHGGLGIGLTLVKSLVEMHQGTVEVRSAGLGQGSEFVVRVPRVAEKSPEAAEQAGETETSQEPPSLRILVVDDNRDSAESLGTLLDVMGNQVRTANDGPASLEEARSFRPHVILLDIGMPGMSGYEVAQRIREHPELRKATLVAVTGWGQDEDRRRSREAGFDHHLTKPVELAALERLLASRSAGRSSQAEDWP